MPSHIVNKVNKLIFPSLFTVLAALSPARASWETMGPAGGYLRAMARAFSNESVIYAASFTNPSHVVKSTDTGGSGMYRWHINTGAEEKNPAGMGVVSQPYPNPARGHVRIDYAIARESMVALGIYDIQGRHVRTLVHAGRQSPGLHSVQWNGYNDDNQRAASGVYFYRLSVSNQAPVVRKLILAK